VTYSIMQVLITGCYRSGTEYATLLLNNHPDLTATMYVTNFMRFCYGRYDPVNVPANYSRLVFDTAQRVRERWHRKLDAHRILDLCDGETEVTYGMLYDLLMRDLFLEWRTGAWAEKTQLVWSKIPAFLDILPRSKVIHIVRDPRSVLASFKRYTYAPPPAYLGAVFNCFGSMKAGVTYRNDLPAGRYLLVRYEDLILQPEETLIGMFDFLGMSHEHDVLCEDGWVDATGKPWGHNSAFSDSGSRDGRFDKQASVDRWKKHLNEDELVLCERITGDLLQAYGYGTSGAVREWERVIQPVLADDRLKEYLHRWEVDGMGVEEFPTDPLQPENWEENAISR